MESENEYSPLLNSLEPANWRTNLKRRCLRVPSEITITGIILGLFLIVVTLLILLQNLQSTPTQELVLEENLLGSPMKYDGKNLGKSWQEKVDAKKSKDKEKNKEKNVDKRTERQSTESTESTLGTSVNYAPNLKKSWQGNDENTKTKNKDKSKDKNVDKRTERASTRPSLLESPFKYNKKIPENFGYGDEEFFIPSELSQKWNKVDKGWKKTPDNLPEFPLGSPMKFNKKEMDESWKTKKNFFINEDRSNKPGDMNKMWEKPSFNVLGSPFKYSKKDLDTTWQEKKELYRPTENDKKWDNVNKGWKKFGNNFLGEDSSKDFITDEDFDNAFGNMENVLSSSDKKFDNVDKGWKKLSDKLLLGSPSNYEDEELDDFWKKMESLEELDKNLPSKKWNNVDKGWKKLSDLGWNGKDIKKALIESWMEGQDFLASQLNSPDVKWNEIDDGWKKLAEQGWTYRDIKQALIGAWKKGMRTLRSRLVFDNKTWKQVNGGWNKFSNRSISVAAPSTCPLSLMSAGQSLDAPIPQEQVDCALIAEEMRKKLGKCVDMTFLPKQCKPTWRMKCFTTYKYRKADGTCNNKIHPTWGQSGTPFVRMVEPDYSDGVSALRKAKSGDDLPNARLLSRKLYSKKMKPDSNATMLFLNFGLLVDHDMVLTAIDSNTLPCCDEQYAMYPETRPRECLQINVPADDPFYGPRNVKCLNLMRSTPVHGECMGRREQLNKATSFLDASIVYGSTIQQMKSLRSFSKGELRTQIINNEPFMSNQESAGFSCGTPSEPLKCFAAGDSRVNMMVELTAMHTIWYREHNRIANELHKLNPKWTDETLFQEARRILIAEFQNIAYQEFLPELLGENALNNYELNVKPDENYDGYDDSIDPSVFNVFGAAAFRFGHSLAQGVLKLYGPGNKAEGQVPLHETFFNAQLLYHNGLDLLIRGAALQRTHSVDSYITPEAREHLFQPAGLDYGHDLAAVSIQRGRDHGLPAYYKWREVCGLPEIQEWDDLYDVMDEERADTLKEIYESVEDIDLIPGALAEHHVDGSLLGPTYLCIIGRQFKKTRKGDRFWFENQKQPGSFRKDQLEEIYKSNMARIVCDNSDNIENIQKYPFLVPSAKNPSVSCDEIPSVDLSKWMS